MDVVQICNLAISQVGAKHITSLDDASTEARICKALYVSTRDAMLAAHEWSFAKARISINADVAVPDFDWAHQFALPSTVLEVLRCDDGSGYGDHLWERQGQKILSDFAGPLRVTVLQRLEDPGLFSAGFAHALAFQLAADICVPLTESGTRHELLVKLAALKLRSAVTVDGMQGSPEIMRGPDMISRRGSR